MNDHSFEAERVPWIDPDVHSLERAIAFAIAYADVYDYPLKPAEITRYLVGVEASRAEVDAALRSLSAPEGPLACKDGYVTLTGRESLVALRQRRADIAAEMWPRALRYGREIARIPFVRMVAVTGALTMGNVESDDDIDYFMITEPGRLWLSRFFIIQMVVKPAAREGDEVCPNYLVSTRAMTLFTHDLYHAHELAQMVPLHGWGVYRRFREANRWVARFLPNATDPPDIKGVTSQHSETAPDRRRLPERVLRTPPGGWLDRREMKRMREKLAAENGHGEVEVSPDRCKGHIGAHGHRAFEAFVTRSRQVVRDYR